VSFRIEFHELVDTDLSHAWSWYEDQERGLGDRFLEAVFATVLRASRWPNTGAPALHDQHDEIVERKLPAHGFPYAVRYRILDDDRLIVMAVLHQHRHPHFVTDRQP
jgi:plasmid stabilization system protein ParE